MEYYAKYEKYKKKYLDLMQQINDIQIGGKNDKSKKSVRKINGGKYLQLEKYFHINCHNI